MPVDVVSMGMAIRSRQCPLPLPSSLSLPKKTAPGTARADEAGSRAFGPGRAPDDGGAYRDAAGAIGVAAPGDVEGAGSATKPMRFSPAACTVPMSSATVP